MPSQNIVLHPLAVKNLLLYVTYLANYILLFLVLLPSLWTIVQTVTNFFVHACILTNLPSAAMLMVYVF